MIVHATRRAMLAPPLVAALAVLASHVSPVAALERRDVVCELEDLTRRVSLRADPEAGYVCDVLYEKPTEGDTSEVLWSARNDEDYCEPRFTKLVEDLASRGWTCAPAEGGDAPAARPVAAAEQGARPAATDGTASTGDTMARLRDWCVADVSNEARAEGAGSIDDYCGCVVDTLAAGGLSDADARSIIDGLPVPSSAEGSEPLSPSDRDKRLNTLAVTYEYVADSCR